jgi:hypothetical protein
MYKYRLIKFSDDSYGITQETECGNVKFLNLKHYTECIELRIHNEPIWLDNAIHPTRITIKANAAYAFSRLRSILREYDRETIKEFEA